MKLILCAPCVSGVKYHIHIYSPGSWRPIWFYSIDQVVVLVYCFLFVIKLVTECTILSFHVAALEVYLIITIRVHRTLHLQSASER